MGRRRRWLSKVKKALGSGNKKLQCTKNGEVAEKDEANVPTLRRSEQEPDMFVIRTVDDSHDTVYDIPWSILEEPYMETPAAQNVSTLTDFGIGESDHCANAPVEAVEVTEMTRSVPELDEEEAAIKIQMAFRRHLAKRKLRDLRGIVRLMALIQGSSTKRQTAATLQCMQTLSRVQSQIRARRIRMSEENQALQRQLQQKYEKEVEKMKLTIVDDWNDSTKSKEKLEASLRHRQEAAMRRERALAYAHSFQQKWRNGPKVANPVHLDLISPHWGWSWLERWMDARPWESTTAIDEPNHPFSVDEISKAYYAHRDRNPDTTKKPPPLLTPQRSSRISTRLPSKTRSFPSNATKLKSPNSKSESGEKDLNSKAICSVQTCNQRRRRHSIANSSMIISPRTLASAEAHKARLQKSSSSSGNCYGRFENGSLRGGSVKKPVSSPSSSISAARRHSGPPNVDLSSIKNVDLMS